MINIAAGNSERNYKKLQVISKVYLCNVGKKKSIRLCASDRGREVYKRCLRPMTRVHYMTATTMSMVVGTFVYSERKESSLIQTKLFVFAELCLVCTFDKHTASVEVKLICTHFGTKCI